MNLPPFKFVATPSDWRSCLTALRDQPRLAIDLEANSLYAYREQVCLIQISIPKQDYIVDPVAGLELSEMGRLLENPSVEKIFHAAEYDLILMKRQYGWQLRNLFDTMWATRILGIARCGLASILDTRYNITLNKRYQKANWCKRPLNDAQLLYAQMDTHFLLRLREDLTSELAAAGRTTEAQEIFAEQTQVHINPNDFDPDSFWSINGVKYLTKQEQATAKALNIYRDQQAKRQDRPLFKIFEDRTIVELAQKKPKYPEELSGIHGMSPGQIRRYGRRLVRVIADARQAPFPKKPRNKNPRRPDAVAARYEKLQNWRKETARARGVESDVILGRETMWALAWANPRTPADLNDVDRLGPWRRQTYGPEILMVLRPGRRNR